MSNAIKSPCVELVVELTPKFTNSNTGVSSTETTISVTKNINNEIKTY